MIPIRRERLEFEAQLLRHGGRGFVLGVGDPDDSLKPKNVNAVSENGFGRLGRGLTGR
jgi:hypothetical protein